MSTRQPFQFDQPTYVKIPFTGRNHTFRRNELFDWKKLRIAPERALVMYNQGYLYQEAAAAKPTAKEVLSKEFEGLSMRDLQEIARKEGADTTTSKDKQIALILENRKRMDAENDALAAKERGDISAEEVEAEMEARRAAAAQALSEE